MKIYTKTGDDGSTGLYGGERIAKDDLRVHAYGAVDEANAALGLARTWLLGGVDRERVGGSDGLASLIEQLQNTLFDLGADLATPLDSRYRANLTPISEDDIARLEAAIDRYDGDLVPLTTFVLPGGHPVAAGLHLARTVVRRAERAVVALGAGACNPAAVIYLNRLSDLLFVLARTVNHSSGIGDTLWRKRNGYEAG